MTNMTNMTTTELATNVSRIKPQKVDGRTLRDVRGPKGPSTRVAWSGGLSMEELARPGGTLLSLLVHRANDLGHQLGDMADKLGVTYGYIAQLRSGIRKTEHVSDNFVDACALYLGTTRKTVLQASSRIKSGDIFSDPAGMASLLPRAISFMANDPSFGPLVPTGLAEADSALQYFLVALFEDATKTTLLPGRESAVSLANQIRAFNEVRSELIAKSEEKSCQS